MKPAEQSHPGPKADASSCELAVIGTGLAGLAATLFASEKGIYTAQIGVNAGIIHASGFLDLMGVHPIADGRVWENPWEAIDAVTTDIPDHPYARLPQADIRQAFDIFMNLMKAAGLPYRYQPDANSRVITTLGTLKPTYGVPESMYKGTEALKTQKKCLMVDFWGLKGFSAVQLEEMLRDRWPGLQSVRIAFPEVGPSVDLYPEKMARALELRTHREDLAREIRPHLNGAEIVGMPAIFGIYHTREVMADLAALIGADVFEIPTIPPAVPGLRIKEMMEAQIQSKGIPLFAQKRVLQVNHDNDGGFVLDIGEPATQSISHRLHAQGVILAGGRFLGGGLYAGRKKIVEPLFGLPVFQPPERTQWHCSQVFDPRGHPVNMAGIEIDDAFRPLDDSGKPAWKNLYAAGAILAHQDWMRMKCGAGISIATAYGAVNAFAMNARP